MPTLHVLRVFVDEHGEWGNPLGVFLDGGEIPDGERQSIAGDLGFSETVFLLDRAAGSMRIHTPEVELPFAGHPIVGAAWLLARGGTPVEALRPPAGAVSVRRSHEATYIAADPEWAPPFEYRRLDSPAAVQAIAATAQRANTYAWAWVDEVAATIRARAFVPAAGVAEDEATGSAALALCARLGRPLTIRQGHGSILRCNPLGAGRAEVGGKVRLVETREVATGRPQRGPSDGARP